VRTVRNRKQNNQGKENRQEQRRYDMNVRSRMQGGKNRILPKVMNANRFFRDCHWLEIWKNWEKPLLSLYGTERRERGYGLRRQEGSGRWRTATVGTSDWRNQGRENSEK
jgi:hypothetical protein